MNTVLTKAKHVFLRRSIPKLNNDLTLQQILMKEIKQQKKSATQHAMIGILITTALLFFFTFI